MLAVPLLQFVTANLPDVTVEIIEGSSSDLAELVATQKLDMCIAMDAQQRPSMHVVPLLDEELMAVGPGGGHGDEPLTLAEVASRPLLLPSFPNSVRVLTDRAFGAAGLELNLVAETSAVSVLLSAVKYGMGWTILPWSALANERPEEFVCVQISASTLVRRVSLCVAASARLSLAGKAVESTTLSLISVAIRTNAWRGVKPLSNLSSLATDGRSAI